MRSISVSEIKSYLRCREEHRLAYVLRVRPRRQAWDLRFGTAVHEGVGEWWRTGSLARSIAAFGRAADGLDAFDLVLGEVILTGYDARWEGEQSAIETVEIERPFWLLRSAHVPHWQITGKLDNVHRRRGALRVGELKTTSSEIGPGANYWHGLAFDLQISVYAMAARALGLDPDVCAYDVIRKPGIEPKKATPVESQKRKKDGTLYANQREADETPGEYRQRLLEVIAAEPEAYYQRVEVVRLEHEHARALADVDVVAADILRTEADEPQIRTSEACRRFGRLCEYHGVCCGTESLDSERFVHLGRVRE